jgi:hypothetical protein
MHPSLRSLAPVAALLAALAAAASASAQNTFLFEAESITADGVVAESAPDALGGRFVTQARDYNPLVTFSLPTLPSREVHVWARIRGYAVQLKTAPPGSPGMMEHSWNWSRPATWRWIQLATLQGENRTGTAMVIRAPTAPAGAGLDAVLVTSDAALDPDKPGVIDALSRSPAATPPPIPAPAPTASVAPSAPRNGGFYAEPPVDALVTEAEEIPGSGDSVVEDPNASGGRYAFNPRAYNPVVKVPVPAGQGAVTLWIRVRGGPFQLKAERDGVQKELRWLWDKPTAWTWISFGRFQRTDLGTSMIIIRGEQMPPGSGIDTVIVSPMPSYNPGAL